MQASIHTDATAGGRRRGGREERLVQRTFVLEQNAQTSVRLGARILLTKNRR